MMFFMANNIDYGDIFRHCVPGPYYGDIQSLFRGQWIERIDSRPYVIGDDARRINWKISAKQKQLHVDILQKQTDARVKFFFDINSNWRLYVNDFWENIIIQYYVDFVVYCLQHNIFVECFTVQKDSIIATTIGKDRIKAHAFVSELDAMIAQETQLTYHSWGKTFLDYILQNSQIDFVILFSDFLWMDEQSYEDLHVLLQSMQIYLVVLPIPDAGYNYEQWYMDMPLLTQFPHIMIDAL